MNENKDQVLCFVYAVGILSAQNEIGFDWFFFNQLDVNKGIFGYVTFMKEKKKLPKMAYFPNQKNKDSH